MYLRKRLSFQTKILNLKKETIRKENSKYENNKSKRF